MIIGYTAFMGETNLTYKTEIYHPTYGGLELKNLTVDDVYIDDNITIPYLTEKPNGWGFRTVLYATFKNTIEGGSIEAKGFQIEKVRFQRREVDDVHWEDVGEFEYRAGDFLYDILDKNIQNGFEYEYSLIPIAANLVGSRILSNKVKAEFEGIFLSDKNNNYRLIYNLDTGTLEHNTSNAIMEPLNSEFPMIIDGSLDYRSGGISALFISTETSKNNGRVDIKAEKLNREKLMKFIKNKKPKVIRQSNGETMLIKIVGKPQEEHIDNVSGIARVAFNFVEVGKMNSETLIENDIIHRTGEFGYE